MTSSAFSRQGNPRILRVDEPTEVEMRSLSAVIVDSGHYLPEGYSMRRMIDVFQRGKGRPSSREWYLFQVSRILGALTGSRLSVGAYDLEVDVLPSFAVDLADDIRSASPGPAKWMVAPQLFTPSPVTARTPEERTRIVKRVVDLVERLEKATAEDGWDLPAAAQELRLGSDQDLYMGFAYGLKLNLTVTDQAARGEAPDQSAVQAVEEAAASAGT